MISVQINPGCFVPGDASYNAQFADMESRGRKGVIRINIEIPSSIVDFEQIFPRISETDRLKGFTPHTFHIMVNPKLVDETALQYAGTGFQGALMFGIAHHVQLGLAVVTDVATGVVRTAAQLRNYAVNGNWNA